MHWNGYLTSRLVIFICAFALLGCKSAGDIRLYSMDPDRQVLTRDDKFIEFDDERLQCRDTDEGRECPYFALSAEDMRTVLELIEECGIVSGVQ